MKAFAEKISILSSLESGWIVDKPAGLSVHNASADSGTVDLLLVLKQQLQLPELPLPVNRLDKETSGVMVLAADSKTAAKLSQALVKDSSAKQYLAILRGQLQVPAATNEFVWNWPISDKAEGRLNPQGKSADRVAAETRLCVIEQNRYFTLAKLILESGRQHQIRKHAAIAKHAIVGDTRYGDKKYNQMIASRYARERMFLHSHILNFEFEGEVIRAEAQIPNEFSNLFPKQ